MTSDTIMLYAIDISYRLSTFASTYLHTYIISYSSPDIDLKVHMI